MAQLSTLDTLRKLMKILAIERPGVATSSPETTRTLQIKQADRLRALYLAGILRECYSTPQHGTILVLECADEQEATAWLNKLPLAREHQILYEVVPLIPFTGFEVLFHCCPN